MIFIYLQTIISGKKIEIPFRIITLNNDGAGISVFNFSPSVSVSKSVFTQQKLDRLEIASASPFLDIADDLIEEINMTPLVFSDPKQFNLLKSQFKTIGYNFEIKPIFLWNRVEDRKKTIDTYVKSTFHFPFQSIDYAKTYVQSMYAYKTNYAQLLADETSKIITDHKLDWSSYKQAPGVYYFLNADEEIIYVGKAKNIRKRLQSHFSQQSTSSTISYSEVKEIDVEYTGNDVIAQLLESQRIKSIQPIYNKQQLHDAAPFVINKGCTAKGINNLKIVRKAHIDNLPERYFNRTSVKNALIDFCDTYNLCRKHCGIETVKGPCSKVTKDCLACVCDLSELIANYNKRFAIAFFQFKHKKTHSIYKLKGRTMHEDGFVYTLNGIYEGFGFIDKDEVISNENDILGHLNKQTNNYDTSRIVSKLMTQISKDHILNLSL
ncbi:MAG: GIY-YIG nuclease family protein [Psychroserpens sp.]|uniref:GIY-YIG nuclease family protein n=1 Tax=Psychroserpens sp. TaxID=2020870 RepID=UPI003C8C498E